MLGNLTNLLAAYDVRVLPEQLVNGIMNGSLYALVALGYTMVYGVLKLINFAHGEVYMLGAYIALFVSWKLGFTPNHGLTSSSPLNLLIMLIVSMVVCALIGAGIERLAYRPMRSQPRIAALITAIGISLLLQYGGQLFLPTSPPPNIDVRVNPYPDNVTLAIVPADSKLLGEAKLLLPAIESAQKAFDDQLKADKTDQFNLTEEGKRKRGLVADAKRTYDEKINAANAKAVNITVSKGRLIILATTLVLMGILTYLVMFTKRGRAMRAVSHDFQSASLMGIKVNSIITFTFILGSALAGAAAMMKATFIGGTKIDTFFGMLDGTKAFVAAVLGGIGNIPGAVLGGFLMGIAESLVDWIGLGGYRDAIAFVVLILVLLVRPGGLLGSAKVEKV